MKKQYFAVAVAAVAVSGLAVAGPALATGTNYKVDVGLAAGAANPGITAASTTSQILSTPSATATCTSANVPSQTTNNVTNSPTANVLKLASLAKVNFVGCSGPGGSLTVTQNGTWELHGVSGATNNATDTISGHIDNISASVSNLACKFTVTGKANGTYNESTKVLKVSETGFTGNLKIASGASCGSDIIAGQSANFTGTFQVSVDGNRVINVKP